MHRPEQSSNASREPKARPSFPRRSLGNRSHATCRFGTGCVEKPGSRTCPVMTYATGLRATPCCKASRYWSSPACFIARWIISVARGHRVRQGSVLHFLLLTCAPRHVATPCRDRAGAQAKQHGSRSRSSEGRDSLVSPLCAVTGAPCMYLQAFLRNTQ